MLPQKLQNSHNPLLYSVPTLTKSSQFDLSIKRLLNGISEVFKICEQDDIFRLNFMLVSRVD